MELIDNIRIFAPDSKKQNYELSIKSILGSALLAAMPLMFTSCGGTLDDIIGESSNPTPMG